MAKGVWCLPDDLVDARPGGFDLPPAPEAAAEEPEAAAP
jgi:hypothetical protein